MRTLASWATLVAALVLGAAIPRVALATPGKDACTGMLQLTGPGTSVTVSTAGVWCLGADWDSEVGYEAGQFPMVAVDADDVTIDCRGYRLAFRGTAEVAYGVATLGTRSRVTVRNCRLVGFSDAIGIRGNEFLIEDNVVEANVETVFGDGLTIVGEGSGTIRRNRVRDAINRGITAHGSSQVIDNVIDGVVETSLYPDAFGIEIVDAAGALVRGNTVRGLVSSSPDQRVAVRILDPELDDTRSVVADNVLVLDGSNGPVGVHCDSGARASGNVIVGFSTSLGPECVDTGDNDLAP